VSITQAQLPGGTAAAIGVAALGVIVFDAGWQVVRHFTVMAHEGAHALVGFFLFRSVRGVALYADATGATEISPTTGLGGISIALSGYVGPSAFGLGAAKLIEVNYATVVLWVVLFLLAVLLLGMRWSFGLISVFLAGASVFAIARYTPMPIQVVASYTIAWLLLLSGVRRVLEVGTASADGGLLRGMTGLPQALWFLLWLAATLAAAAVGARLLVLRA
jgi:Peptidase M50B-like